MTNDFSGFGLPAKLMQALERMQFKTPTPIQNEAIPIAMADGDILGTAQTGTGKTGAFGIPLIAKLMEHPAAQALVMTPTRELATQVMAAMQQMINVPNIKTALLIGGEAMPRQLRQLDHHPRLIVGTPGRITDHLMRGSLKLAHARYLVLDETDRMLDMGFGPQIDKIMEYMPSARQTMMFSATLPENIVRMSRKYLKEPKRISVGSTNTAHHKIKQEIIKMGEGEKYQHLLAQLSQREGSVIIFVKTKYGTEKLSDKLNKDQHKSDAIHGDLQQRRRDRVIQGFRDKRYRILVATDVAARGLDIPHIEHVINYDLPQCPEDYIHRIGRTARAGAEGSAVNFITSSDHIKWNAIHRLMNPGAPSPSGGDRREHNRGGNGHRRGGSGKRWGAPGERSGGGRGERAAGAGGGYRGNRDRNERPAFAERSSSGEHKAGYRGEAHRTADSAQRSPRADHRSEAPHHRKADGGQRADAAHRNDGERYRKAEGGYRNAAAGHRTASGESYRKAEGGHRSASGGHHRGQGGSKAHKAATSH